MDTTSAFIYINCAVPLTVSHPCHHSCCFRNFLGNPSPNYSQSNSQQSVMHEFNGTKVILNKGNTQAMKRFPMPDTEKNSTYKHKFHCSIVTWNGLKLRLICELSTTPPYWCVSFLFVTATIGERSRFARIAWDFYKCFCMFVSCLVSWDGWGRSWFFRQLACRLCWEFSQ